MSAPRFSLGDPDRSKFFLKLLVGFLLATAFLLLVMPLRMPRPLRLLLFSTDVLAAGAIWVLGCIRLKR